MKTVRVGLVGSQFVTSIHCEALRSVPETEIVAVTSATEAHARSFAERHGIRRWFTDYRKMYELPDLDLVVLGLPNDLHCDATVTAAAAGKHVLCEKPLCLNLAEADRMIDACRQAGVKLMYAEELCFTPKYVRLKQLVDEGTLGRIHLVKQAEKHDGPHAAWFWDVRRSGGGVARETAVPWTRCLERGLCYAYACWEVLEARRPRPVDLVLGRSAGLGSTLFVPAALPRVPIVNLFDSFHHAHAHDLAGEASPDTPPDYFHWRQAANAMDLLDLENGVTAWVPTRWQRDLFPAEYRDDFTVLFDGVRPGNRRARAA